jgi:hypothetical protein
MLTFSSGTYAADLSGIITDRTGRGAQGAAVAVTCGDFSKSVFTAISGNYHIADLPDESECRLTITFRGVSSQPHDFRTTTGRMTFSRRVQPHEGHLEFL